jgi:S-methylmethionine-dependent homocysteine/selenocysteine methylase
VRARILGDALLLLDGATGTELERRGLPTALPLWSAPALRDHPHVVREIHAEYARTGVDALTANTFRTQRSVLAGGGLADEAEALTRRAVELAREGSRAVADPPWVFGSVPPLADCYRPDLVPDRETLEREHAEHLRCLDAAGVDAVLVETMNTLREAEIATRAAGARGLPAIASFVCWDGDRLLDGSPLETAARGVLEAGALGVAVNCLPPSNVAACLETLSRLGAPFGVYANLGEPDDRTGFRRSEDCTPEAFAAHASGWRDRGARLIGGCCGTTPDHLRALHRALVAGPER